MACLTMNFYTLKTYMYFKARVAFFFTACAQYLSDVFKLLPCKENGKAPFQIED